MLWENIKKGGGTKTAVRRKAKKEKEKRLFGMWRHLCPYPLCNSDIHAFNADPQLTPHFSCDVSTYGPRKVCAEVTKK